MIIFRSIGELLHTTPFLALLYVALPLMLILALTRRYWVEPFFAWYRRKFLQITVTALILLFFLVYLAPDIFFTMGSGEVGVLWSRFGGGTRVGIPYPEGTFAKLPWDRIYKYDVRFQTATEQVHATTVEGLSIRVDLNVRFRVIDERAGLLHKQVGPQYVSRLVLPELAAYSQHVIARHTAQEIYSGPKEAIQGEIFQAMRSKLPIRYDRTINPERTLRAQSADFVELEALLIEAIVLPKRVQQAVESKLEQMLLNEEYVYRLARERNEMVRKGIEGEGIALFQSKVAEGISDRYLKWKGIDATLELAQSNNAKIVVIGSARDGLPLILGGFGEESAGGARVQGGIGPQGSTPNGRTGGAAAVSPQGSGTVGNPSPRAPSDQPSLVEAERLIQRWLRGQADVKEIMDDSMRKAQRLGSGPKTGEAGKPENGDPQRP